MAYTTFIAAFVSAALLIPSVDAARLTVGATYPIEERDALEAIQARAEHVDWAKVYRKDPGTWAALQSVRLPNAPKDRERRHQPIYVVEQDVIDRNGKLLYPKGYHYNPLDYVRLPWRILVIGDDSHHLVWLAANRRDTDQVYTAGGNTRELSERLAQPVFIVTPRVRERLRLRAVPSVIEQHGDTLVIREVHVQPH